MKILSQRINIRNIIIAIPSLSRRNRDKIIKKLIPICSSISSLPEKNFYKLNKINFNDLSEIPLDELFNKNKNDLKTLNLSNFTKKNIWLQEELEVLELKSRNNF